MSTALVRFTVSMPAPTVRGLDRVAKGRGFPNRSQALAALIREGVADYDARLDTTVMMGVLTFTYEHRRRNLQNRITDLQHRHLKEIVTIQLVHLEKHQSLQILVVQGPAQILRQLKDVFASLKGVQHASLQLNSTVLPPLHDKPARR
ncbi:MAG: CopG family ribbon-helix-helix protein [Candidatus Methylacidiphilales bacterium]|nr:CopG family ribbon-helix-helix protein [Candidatus Methylacidiphilales bacterium]